MAVIDPLDGDPTFVEFKSRIREARRSDPGDPPGMVDRQKDLDLHEWVYDSLSPSRAAELGVVVSLLTRAEDSTIRQIREILEDEVGKGADPED